VSVVPRARARIVALVLASVVASALAGCSSCRRKNEEPSRDPNFDPRSDAAPRPSASARAPGLTPAEQRDFRTRLDPDLCSEGAKRVNALHGRSPTDPIAVDIVSSCLKYGNNAWYKCVLLAPAAEDVDACGRKFLLPPDEAPGLK
jgi:uncharacterized lipoprotein